MNLPTRRILAAVATAGMVAALATACGGDSSGEEGASGGTFVYGSSADPKVLDPAFVYDVESERVIDQMYEGLVTLKPGTPDVEPGLAESWDTSADGLEWTFNLRTGVKFHDGTDFNAEAACWTFDRSYNFTGAQQLSGVSTYWRNTFGGFATQADPTSPATSNYAGCEVIDEKTIKLKVNKPDMSLLPALAAEGFYMVSPTAVEKYGDDVEAGDGGVQFTGTFGTEHPVGTGPFKFVSWTRGDKLTLEANKDYWDGAPKLDQLIFRPIADGPSRMQALQAGELDGYDQVSPADVETLKSEGFEMLERPAFNIGYLGLNMNQAPLDNEQIRYAVAHAINRPALIQAQFGDLGEVAQELQPPTLMGYNKDVPKYDYNPEKAKQLIADSGVTNLTIKITYPSGVSRPYMPDPKAIIESIKADLEAVGFTIEVGTAPWTPEYIAGIYAGDWQSYIVGRNGDFADPADYLGSTWGRPSPRFPAPDPTIFDRFELAKQETDPAKREKMYQDLNAELMTILPAIPLVHSKTVLAFKPGVTGYEPSPMSLEVMKDLAFSE